ncbi:CKLF-like MARVEL transmembrane domain-containing protein 5 isoform X1 [Dromaius novaehollandiae]|uniref:CKLF-like MARVEL transmembrane domain-containing protein 5 isoform X1 n=1 Tax=Dromaius novaehollandiae TaxID=8790 RepID=UPI00311FB192
MGEQEAAGAFDLGGLRTPKGLLLSAELALAVGLLGLLAPPGAPTLAPVLLQALAGAAALGGRLLRHPPRLPHGACLDFLRAASGTLVFLVTALAAIAASRDALAATTFTFGLVLAALFAFDAFVTFRSDLAPAAGGDPDTESA